MRTTKSGKDRLAGGWQAKGGRGEQLDVTRHNSRNGSKKKGKSFNYGRENTD